VEDYTRSTGAARIFAIAELEDVKMSTTQRLYRRSKAMSANLENAIQEKVHRLNDEQQQQVMAFVEGLESGPHDHHGRRFSFVGVARSGKGRTKCKRNPSVVRK
jgi:hypothetical protein